jgi:hypothetical protein
VTGHQVDVLTLFLASLTGALSVTGLVAVIAEKHRPKGDR